jgi:hypothetical protein
MGGSSTGGLPGGGSSTTGSPTNGNGNGKGGNGNGPNSSTNSSDMGGSSGGGGGTSSSPGNGNAYGHDKANNNAGGNGHGPFSTDMGGATQCGYVPDLPYCTSSSSSGSPEGNSSDMGGSSSGGSSSGGGSTSGGSPSGNGAVCAPSDSSSSDSSEGGSATSETPGIAATGIVCADHPFGSPESECGHFGMTPSGKDENVGGLSCTASQSAGMAIVKSGTKGCAHGQIAYNVYTGVTKGDTLNTPAGQDISHVTYCSGTPTAPAPSTAGAAPAPPKGPPPADSCTSTTVKTRYKCVQDKKGNRSCETIPACAPGSHPGSCGACIEDGSNDDCIPQSEGGCWVTGGGFIVAPNDVTGAPEDGHDSFGGNAKPMKKGGVQGHWNHVDHGTKNHAKGKPEYIVCRHVNEPGPGNPGGKKGFNMNQVYFGGHAEWREHDLGDWQSGYWFDVVAKDHGEPGSQPSPKNGFMPDTYHFTIRKMDDPAAKVSGALVYETHGTLVGGNIQIHPPNGGHPYTPMSLPPFVAFEP